MTVLVARESMVAPGHRAIPKGSLVDSSDPVVKANPDLFESPEDAAKRAPDAHEGTKDEPEEAPADEAPAKRRLTRK